MAGLFYALVGRIGSMDEKRTNKSSPVWAVVVLLVLASVPLYVLSIGPAVYLLNVGFIRSTKPIETFYAPLVWAAERWEPLDRVHRYIHLWVR
jgi:hypothetical protein